MSTKNIPRPEEALEQWLDTPLLQAITGDKSLNVGPTMRSMMKPEDLSAIKMAFVSGYTAAFSNFKDAVLAEMKEKGIPIPVVVDEDTVPKTPQ